MGGGFAPRFFCSCCRLLKRRFFENSFLGILTIPNVVQLLGVLRRDGNYYDLGTSLGS